MKTSKEIINHLKDTPTFYKLKEQDMLKKLLDILPLKLKTGIKFLYLKEKILFIVLRDRIYKMEIKYAIRDIKLTLKYLNLDISDIQYFVTNQKDEEKVESKTDIFYIESSKGTFSNNFEDRESTQNFRRD